MNNWATSAGHWYKQDGTPAYTVIGKNGKERPTNVRDARELGLVPSVTTIIRCAAAPGLDRWKSEQLLMAGLTLPKNPGETEKSWIARVWQDSAEQGKKAAEHGTRIHAAIEGHYRGQVPSDEMWPYVRGTIEVIHEAFGEQKWLPERSFAEKEYGFGGKVDLHADGIVLDFKGKDGDLIGVECYDEHYMQLAAYAVGLDLWEPRLRCGIVFVSRTHPGMAKLVLHTPKQQERGWQMFSGLLEYWRAANSVGMKVDRGASETVAIPSVA